MTAIVTNLRDLRLTPVETLERDFWSHGRPALPGAPRPPRVEEVDPATVDSIAALMGMTAEQYAHATPAQLARATERAEPPSIARAAWLAGARVDSLDLAFETEDGTEQLAENVPTTNPAYDRLVTLIAPADMTPEQRAAYDEFCAERASESGAGVPYTIEDPAVRGRIEWERWFRACSDVQTEGLRPTADGQHMTFFSLVGRRLDRNEFLERKQRWVAAFLARTGLDKVPSAAEFATKRSTYQMLRNTASFEPLAEIGRFLADALAPGEEPIDDLAANSFEFRDEPYVPAFATLLLVAEAEQDSCRWDARWTPKRNARYHRDRVQRRAVYLFRQARKRAEAERRAAAKATPLVHHRSPRLHGRRDELYHGTLVEAEVEPTAVTLGFAD
jgi:hypothetical protein